MPRLLAASTAALILTSCSPSLQFNPNDMSPEQMLQRATLVLIGVVEYQQYDSHPWFRIPNPTPESKYWKILRRQIRVESVLRGTYTRPTIPIYEISWTGGASGNWNAIHTGHRALFLVHVENGRHHVVRDWWRSIFPVATPPPHTLPLDEATPFWERYALMTHWIRQSRLSVSFNSFNHYYADPGLALTSWRRAKILRGYLRHPSPKIYLYGCRSLIAIDRGQDECWDRLNQNEKDFLETNYPGWCRQSDIQKRRLTDAARPPSHWWNIYKDQDTRRLFTAFNHPPHRAAFCRLYTAEYPNDTDHACPANTPPPATIVTQQGDIPLTGPWPENN